MPDRLEFPKGQLGAATVGPSPRVPAPDHHTAVPDGPLDSVRITLDRSQCYGTCPSYSVELRGDGFATYDGKDYVLVFGRHGFEVPKADVECLLAQLKQADFWSLASEYVADITDGPQYRLSLTVGGQTKAVIDYFGAMVGMPPKLVGIENEIDRIAADRWVKGTKETLAGLKAEHFDFHSAQAATMLASAVEDAPDDLVLGLIAAGASTTGRLRGRKDGPTAVERASRAGRATIVEALIAHGAFSEGSPDVKEAALRAAAASGNPTVVAEILRHKPAVNAQDRNGATALIGIWAARGYGQKHAPIDLADVARLLLDAGADPNIADRDGVTALFSASDAEVVRLLVRAGAKPNVRNKFGATPLLRVNSDDAALALIEAGADTSATDKSGLTIEKLASDRKYVRTLQRLHAGKP